MGSSARWIGHTARAPGWRWPDSPSSSTSSRTRRGEPGGWARGPTPSRDSIDRPRRPRSVPVRSLRRPGSLGHASARSWSSGASTRPPRCARARPSTCGATGASSTPPPRTTGCSCTCPVSRAGELRPARGRPGLRSLPVGPRRAGPSDRRARHPCGHAARRLPDAPRNVAAIHGPAAPRPLVRPSPGAPRGHHRNPRRQPLTRAPPPRRSPIRSGTGRARRPGRTDT